MLPIRYIIHIKTQPKYYYVNDIHTPEKGYIYIYIYHGTQNTWNGSSKSLKSLWHLKTSLNRIRHTQLAKEDVKKVKKSRGLNHLSCIPNI